jgi:hypothetical protein
MSLAQRINEFRREVYGEHGAVALATALNLPVETWLNYERGVTMPADVLLDFLEITNADPRWLATGEGGAILVRDV